MNNLVYLLIYYGILYFSKGKRERKNVILFCLGIKKMSLIVRCC